MAIRIDALRAAASRKTTVLAKSLNEARTLGAKTAFLCHSHHDSELANGLVQLLSEAGWRVYIDWQDAQMPESPNQETAQRIKQKIVDLEYFLFLATPKSMASRWCPWEIGYADGVKPIRSILVATTRDNAGTTHGSEYLDLYRKVDFSKFNRLAVWEPGEEMGVALASM